MTSPDQNSQGKTALTDDDAVQFHLVKKDDQGLTPEQARAFLARPIQPIDREDQTGA